MPYSDLIELGSTYEEFCQINHVSGAEALKKLLNLKQKLCAKVEHD